MLSDIHILGGGGVLKGPHPNSSILAVVNFVEKHLILFSERYINSNIKNERGLTQKLVSMLSLAANKEGCLFRFDKEYMENPEKGSSHAVDLGVLTNIEEGIFIGVKHYTNEESFFSMEAKRLYKAPKTREKEYLIGRTRKNKYIECGGVERFKKGIHGKRLNSCAMIGYVQEYNFDYWHNKINEWISSLIIESKTQTVKWAKEDQLMNEHTKAQVARYRSFNSRLKDSITLFHLWVKLVEFD
jgi:hypothetical protein